MVKTLLAQVKEYKRDSILTPVFMILEVIFETLIPLLMASIINDGVMKGDLKHIYIVGAAMFVLAVGGLWSGAMGGKYGARASTGFAKNLRKAMYENIQTFSFSNIDKYSTSGLVTRLTTDVTNLQNAYQMILRMCMRSPMSLICAMSMAFYVNAKVACIYLIAVIVLGIFLFVLVRKTMGYFDAVFRKYDDLNESVQENVSAIRVVKAYSREEYEQSKFRKASENVYKMFVKAESLIVLNAPVMMLTVYGCILLISWIGAKMIVGGTMQVGDLSALLGYCMNILMSLMMLSMVFVMITMSIASGERVAEVINDRPDYKFELGKGVVLREGKDLTIIATGLPVSNCLEAAEKLAADGIDAKVINIHTIKPLDEELVVAAAKECGKVVTVEEHSVIGGLGSAVCDVLCEKAPTPVLKIGVQDVFGESGPAVKLLEKYKLDGQGVYEQVKAYM